VPRIHEALRESSRRPPDTVARERGELQVAVASMTPGRAATRAVEPGGTALGPVHRAASPP
jgi:hypothetical protein